MTRIMKMTALVGAVLLALGVLLAVVGFALGGTRYLYQNENRFNLLGWQLEAFDGPEGTDRAELDEFTSIRVEGKFLDFEMRPSDNGKNFIDITCTNGLPKPEYNVKDGMLTITSKWPYKDMKNGTNTYRATVYYPSNAYFHSVSIDLSASDLTLSDFGADTLEIHSSASDVDIINAELTQFNLENAVGDVHIRNTAAEKADLSLDIGSLDGDNFDTSGLTVKVNMGDVDLTGTFREKTTVSVNMGEADLVPTLSPDLYYVTTHGTMDTYTMGTPTAPYVIDAHVNVGESHVTLND